MDLKALEDAFDVREVLDGYAARQATALIGEADKERLRAIIRKCDAMANADMRSIDDLAEELQLELQLHRIIAEVTDNALLYDILSKLLDKSNTSFGLSCSGSMSGMWRARSMRKSSRRFVAAKENTWRR